MGFLPFHLNLLLFSIFFTKYFFILSILRKQITMALKPLISIVGATGTGKSDLAIALALKLNGEIINADAMQMYTGLDIITNKHPVDERAGIPHHLLGVVPITEEIRIGQFRDRALEIVSNGDSEKTIWWRPKRTMLITFRTDSRHPLSRQTPHRRRRHPLLPPITPLQQIHLRGWRLRHRTHHRKPLHHRRTHQ